MFAALLLSAAVAVTPPGSGMHTPPGNGTHTLNAYRLSPATGAPTLDGRLDDAVWQDADSVHSFTQRDPDLGQPARFATVAKVAVDDQAVYVAVRAYDPDPSKMVAQLTRRDEDSPSDWVLVAERPFWKQAPSPAGRFSTIAVPSRTSVWTDDFNNLVEALAR